MSDKVFDHIVSRWEQIIELEPQNVGPFTPLYKIITKRLKVMPWALLMGMSIVIVVLLFFFFGSSIIYIVETLQRGF